MVQQEGVQPIPIILHFKTNTNQVKPQQTEEIGTINQEGKITELFLDKILELAWEKAGLNPTQGLVLKLEQTTQTSILANSMAQVIAKPTLGETTTLLNINLQQTTEEQFQAKLLEETSDQPTLWTNSKDP